MSELNTLIQEQSLVITSQVEMSHACHSMVKIDYAAIYQKEGDELLTFNTWIAI